MCDVGVVCCQLLGCAAAWRSKRGPAKPAKMEDMVDLSAAFGISFGENDSDSSDAEFAPGDHQVDSEGRYFYCFAPLQCT